MEDSNKGLMNDKEEIMDLLICPTCRDNLNHTKDTLFCHSCNRSYPIIEGIITLLPSSFKNG
jgi:uncharacterized protein YbaR (Trm112 family)